MPHQAHLPSALRQKERLEPSELDEMTLLMMIEECEEWQREAERFRSEISSTSTLAVWRALVETDRSSVEEICRSLHEERARRAAARQR